MKIFSNFIDENDPIYAGLKQIDKPITFFYDYIPQNIDQLNINPYNFIMLHEPNEFFGMHSWILNNYPLFTGVLTWNDEILSKCNNAILFHHSCNHLDLDYINSFEDINKTYEVSFLSGTKDLVEGHKLRQEIYNIGDQIIKIPKKWFKVLDDFDQNKFELTGIGRPTDAKSQAKGKHILYNTSMYNIAVENIKTNNWFTEKLSDAFNTRTIPIYWGCPNISDFGYDERGIIRFETVEELINIINNRYPYQYQEMKPYIDHNYNIAKNELKLKEKLELFFQELIKINNI
jgi:hypothetical protein